MSQLTRQLAEIEWRLEELFPELAIAPLRHLQTGFGSIVIETADDVIFRVARHARAADGHAKEARLLPVLRGRVPVALPEPRWRVAPGTAGFPYGAIGYRRLPGTPLSPELVANMGTETIASQLAAFLVALHRSSAREATELGLPHADHDPGALKAFRDDVLPPLRDALGPANFRKVRAWWDAIVSDADMQRFKPTLRHGDLWYDHVLVDEPLARLVAVLDWEAAAIGDPARDFATQFHMGRAFAEATLTAYAAQGGDVDPGLTHRIRRRWELREFGGIRTAVELRDRKEFEDAVRKLRAGPVLDNVTRD